MLNKVTQAIENEKLKLVLYAKEHGIIENFGQDRVRFLKDKYVDNTDYSNEMNSIRNAINSFDNWCATYSLA